MTRNHRLTRSDRGQTVPLFAIILTLLVGFASLAIDSTSNQGSQLGSQLAADTSGLGAAKAWGAEAGFAAGTLPTAANYTTDAMLVQAQQLAGVNGVDTSAGGSCYTGTGSPATQIDVVYYDRSAGSCPAAPSGWTRKVEVTVPPLPTVPATCPAATKWYCVQVQTTMVVANRLFVTIGLAKSTVSASTIALATLAGCTTGVCGWGYNQHGELGDGTTTTTPNPVGPSGLSGIIDIKSGQYDSLALKSDGTVWAWGLNIAPPARRT